MNYLRQAARHNSTTSHESDMQHQQRQQRQQRIQGWRSEDSVMQRGVKTKTRLFGNLNKQQHSYQVQEQPINPNNPFSKLKEMGVVTNRHPDETRIYQLINSIQTGAFDHYVKGGFSRARASILTPVQVAQYHQLDISRCLFEIKDARIEQAIADAGIEVITATSFKIQRKEKRFTSYINTQSQF